MPVLFLETLPLPTLKTYSNISVALFLSTILYAYQTVITQTSALPDEVKQFIHAEDTTSRNESEAPTVFASPTGLRTAEKPKATGPENLYAQHLSVYDLSIGIIDVLTEETWCVWVLVNSAYCLLILVGKLIQRLIFGELRVAEAQHLKDRFWNFVFYKFIFIFGVLNVQHLGEVLTWGAWFSVLGFLHHLSQLSKDRFEYLSFSPTTPRLTHIQVLSLLVTIFLISCGLMGICIKVGLYHDLNTFGFMAAECAILLLKTLYVIARYSIHLWDINQEGTWERRGSFVYYAELLFELTALCFDFIHHLHMLIWGNIFLSMASLVICMQLRFLFHEIQRRCRRHKNYLRVVARMEARYPMSSKEELSSFLLDGGDENCAICWDKMETARRLPCGHFFHNSCLRSWLEQDTSCPTCRTSLQEAPRADAADAADVPSVDGAAPRGGADGGTDADGAARAAAPGPRNHFFHFDGSRYVSWLPSFSVEVTHSLTLGGDPPPIPTSQVESMGREVQAIFPNMPLDLIITDLQVTRSMDMTIDNILEGRLVPPPRRPSPPLQVPLPPNMSSHSSPTTLASSPDTSARSSPSREITSSTSIELDSTSEFERVPPLLSSSSSGEANDDIMELRHRHAPGSSSPDPPSSPTATQVMETPLFSLRPSVSTPDFASDRHVDPLQHSDSRVPLPSSSPSPSPIEAVGGRFSKSSAERESILTKRKTALMQQAKRRFLARQPGDRTADDGDTEDA